MLPTILNENSRRNALLLTPYDPVTGLGATGDRIATLSPSGSM